MASLDDARALISLDHGLASVAIPRSGGAPQMTVVNAGVILHPLHGRDVAAFVARGGTHKLRLLRIDPRATLTWRAGWAWVTVEGSVELCGPDDPLGDVDAERLRWLLRDVYTAAGGGHEDWTEYDRVVQAEHRAVVMITPDRIYQNP